VTRSPLRRSAVVLVFLALATSLLASACVGPRTTVRVPDCVERIEVTGEHHRMSETELIFSHGLDLPLTRTEITVEHADGSREVTVITNMYPDLLRLLGAGLVGALSAAAVGLYTYQVAVGGEQPFLGPTFWALPLGAGGGLIALAIASTGWHPGEDSVIAARCAEAR
jgi:hypothetical protein